MIISRTPHRLDIAGGGSDVPDFYRKSSGAVVSLAINSYVYLALCEKRSGGRSLPNLADGEKARSLTEIERRIFDRVSSRFGADSEKYICAAGAGIGHAAVDAGAFSVGLFQLLHAFQKDHKSQKEIAEEACDLNIEELIIAIGNQTQYGCAFGGLNFFEYLPDDTVCVEPILLRPEEKERLESSLLLYRLDSERTQLPQGEDQNIFKSKDERVLSTLELIADLARRLKVEIGKSVDVVGDYLRESWELKRRLSPSMSTPVADAAYEDAMMAGAKGATLLGPGRGGSLLLYVTPERRQAVMKSLKRYPLHEVKTDAAGAIVFYDDRIK